MTRNSRAVLAVLVLTILAAGAGGWAGVWYAQSRADSSNNLNALLHRQLDLNANQQRRLAALEAAYAKERSDLESRERAANHELAVALLTHHHYGPQAAQALDRFCDAMRELQQATVVHVLAMRATLTPQQARIFDRTVVSALESGRS